MIKNKANKMDNLSTTELFYDWFYWTAALRMMHARFVTRQLKDGDDL